MSKLSHKIIISVLLAVVLWGGIGGIYFAYAQSTSSSWSVGWDTTKGTLKNLFGGDALGIAGEFWAGKAMGVMADLLLFILSALSSLLTIVANIFDKVIYFSLYQVNTYIPITESVKEVWGMIRDTLNIFFIFILIWISIKTILGLSGGETKKLLAMVVVSALFINFSLFITRAVIDAGNLVADGIYKSVIAENATPPNTNTGLVATSYLSGALIKNLGLSSQYTPAKGGTRGPEMLLSVVKIITASIALWAFLQATLLFVVRLVSFFILMALSPIGFIGKSIPYMKTHADKWWSTLINQAMVAPVFLFMILLVIKLGKISAFHQSSSGNELDFTVYFNFIMIIAMMIAAVKLTKTFAGELGNIGMNLGGKMLGAGLGLAIGTVAGGAAFAARNTAGRGAAAYLNTDKGKDLRARAESGDTAARMQLATLDRASKATYDVRNSKMVSKTAGFIGDKAGIKMNVGKGSGVYSKDGKATGYAGQAKTEQEAENKKYNEIAKSVSDQEKKDAQNLITTKTASALQSNQAHTDAENKIKSLTDVSSHKDMIDAQKEIDEAKLDLQTAPPDQQFAANERLKKAQALHNERQTQLVADAKKTHEVEIKKQQGIMDKEAKAAEQTVRSQLTRDEKKVVTRGERAKNYADSIRQGKRWTGKLSTRGEYKKLADNMESQGPRSKEDDILDMLKNLKEEQEKLAKQNKP